MFLYAMGVICLLGVISQLVLNNLYDRMIRDAQSTDLPRGDVYKRQLQCTRHCDRVDSYNDRQDNQDWHQELTRFFNPFFYAQKYDNGCEQDKDHQPDDRLGSLPDKRFKIAVCGCG